MDGESRRRDNREITFQDKIASPRKLSFQFLKDITNNFSVQRVLGGGAFGVVYKGVLPTGDVIAVKRLKALMTGSQKQFENEVYHLMSLNHPNIVRCIGYCYETQNFCLKYDGNHIFAETAERLLCLEYMPNGSLDNHLADELRGLDWHKRYNIISGICYGLHYIHTEWQVNTPIIHLDLKPANILLGDNMLPKIADFGLSRLLGEQQTRVWTGSRDGTLGYMAPEYINRGMITTKSDIFSLGVIIVEIITGYRNYPWPSATGTSNHDFVELVLKKWKKRSEAASPETDYQQIRSCLEMGLSCLETDPEKRPATMEIIERLIGWGSTNFRVGNDERSSTLQITNLFGPSPLPDCAPGADGVAAQYPGVAQNELGALAERFAARSGRERFAARSGRERFRTGPTSDPTEFIVINPRKLQYCLASNKQRCCLVQLTNNTAKHAAFSFGVKRARNNYIIEPSSGFLCPRSTITVFVTLEEVCEFMHCDDEFLVQTIIVRENRLTSNHITDDSFNMSSSVVHKAKLTVAYVPVPPVQPPTLLRAGAEETKASDHWQSEGFPDKKNVDILIRCICQDLGFSGCKPIAAWIVYRCLLHWKSFEDGRTNVFDHIIANMFSTIKAQGNDTLSYWLSNSSALLLLMQKTLKASTVRRFIPRRGKSLSTIIDTIIMRSRAFGGSRLIGGMGLQQVEAKRPALLFKGHLTGFLEKVYRMIRDNLVKEISPLLGCCIEAPTILFDHWQSIVNILTEYMHVLKSNYVPSFLISKMFTQVFSFIDVQLFNSLLLSGCCSLRNGGYIKAGLAKLEQWCTYETEEFAGSSWEELKHIRKAAILLTMCTKQKKALKEITCKQKKTLKDITRHLFPVLSMPQVNFPVTIFDEQEYGVLKRLKSLLEEQGLSNAVGLSVLLDDDLASISFTVDDVLKSMTEFGLAAVDMPPVIRENPCFKFLHK